MRFTVALFGLAIVACSKSEPKPEPAPAPSAEPTASVSASSAPLANESGTCDWGAKCAEWTGDVAAKKKTCGLLAGTWSEAPCAIKKSAVAECTIKGARASGMIYYAPPTKGASQRDCERQGGTHRLVTP